MQIVQTTKYICEICNGEYDNEEEAIKCESKPITYDFQLSISDIILIPQDHCQIFGLIKKIKIKKYEKKLEPWQEYWHTPYYLVEIPGVDSEILVYYDEIELLTPEVQNEIKGIFELTIGDIIKIRRGTWAELYAIVTNITAYNSYNPNKRIHVRNSKRYWDAPRYETTILSSRKKYIVTYDQIELVNTEEQQEIKQKYGIA